MSTTTLSKTEELILTEAAGREHGLLVFPDGMKAVTRQRTLGKLETAGLIAASPEHDGDPVLTPAGYRAVGLRPPCAARIRKAAPEATSGAEVAEAAPTQRRLRTPAASRPGTKQQLVMSMLGRLEGASLAELVEATGWLPHTTRAALSRLRSAGQELTKDPREDGSTAYRIVLDEPKRRGRSKRKVIGAEQAAAA